MKTLAQIIEVMTLVPYDWRWRYCEARVCACMGCVNRYGITKEEHDLFLEFFPEPLTTAEKARTILERVAKGREVKERMAYRTDELLSEIEKALIAGDVYGLGGTLDRRIYK